MSRILRILELHRLFLARREGLTINRIMEFCRCSRPTAYRHLRFLVDVIEAPLEHDNSPERNWRYRQGNTADLQLPGLWLSADTLYGLRMAQQVFQASGAEALEEVVGKVQPSVRKMLDSHAEELSRLRIVRTRGRQVDPAIFRATAQATFERCQLRFDYRSRSTGQNRKRLVSPQCLTHHRDNWYLDAWDHDTLTLRSFALDLIRKPQIIEHPTHDLTDAELETHLQSGYGIFSGPVIGKALIRFTEHAARWVADEQWHPKQHLRRLTDGSIELYIPYSNPRELLMDILRHGPDAEVLHPPELREQMRELLKASLGRYEE